MRRWQWTITGILLLLGSFGLALPARTASADATLAQQIVGAVNQDRVTAGLPVLVTDPRLTTVAQARAAYLMAEGFFSHCTGGEADPACPLSGLDFLPRDRAVGLDVAAPGTTVAENLALNTFPADSAAAQTNAAWLASPEHKANILDSRFAYTGVAVACCFAGTVNGLTILATDKVSVYVQQFAGGAGAVPLPAGAPAPGSPAGCTFVLGFAALAASIPQQVGTCADGEQHNPANGDALQHTTGGLLVWRKLDNWTAFTDGYRTWINGPNGVQERLNSQRFPWEANPAGLPLVP